MSSIQKIVTVCFLLSCSVLASAFSTGSTTLHSSSTQTVLQQNKLPGSHCGPACVYVAGQGCVC